jgi:hypothetical protein
MDVKGILIDPIAQTITEVTVTDYSYDKIYPLVDAQTFDAVVIDDHNAAFLDDEGLWKEDQKFFMLGSYPQPLGGKAFVLGNNSDGDTVSTTLTVEDIAKLVTFRPDVSYVGSDPIAAGTKAQTPFGEAFVVGSTPVFASNLSREEQRKLNEKRGGQ